LKRALTITACIAVLLAALSETADAAGPDLLGPGVRSRVLGGGAVADIADWTTVYWNPAGLTELEDGIFGMNVSHRWSRRRSSKSMPNVSYPDIYQGEFQKVYPVESDTFFRHRISNSVSGVQMGLCYNAKYFALGGLNMPATSINTYFADRAPATSGDMTYGKYQSTIAVLSVPVAAAVPIGNKLSVGAAVHGRMGWRKLYQAKQYAPTSAISPYSAYFTERDEYLIGYAASVDLALLYKPKKKLRIGLVVRTPYKFRFAGTGERYSSITGVKEETDALTRMYYPLQVDAAVAYRLGNDSTISLSFRHTSWNTLRFSTNYRSNSINFIDHSYDMKMRQTLEVGIGFTAALSELVHLFAGIRYEPSPYGRDHASLSTEFYPNALALGLGIEYRLENAVIRFGVIDRTCDRRRHGGHAYGQDDTEIGISIDVGF